MTEGDSEIMEKCELLAEVIMRFFDAIAGADLALWGCELPTQENIPRPKRRVGEVLR